MRTLIVVLLAGFMLAGCANRAAYVHRTDYVPPDVQQRGGWENVNHTSADWRQHINELEIRAKRGELQTAAAVEDAAKAHAEAHVTDRIARNDVVGAREEMVTNATHRFIVAVNSAIEEAHRRRTIEIRDRAVQRVTEAPNPERELRPAATEMVSNQEPPVAGVERERAISKAIEEIRAEVERRHAASLQSRRQAQEADLTRQAMSNLSDMPREIRQAAEKNVAESRSPFERARPKDSAQIKAAIRAEEARLRSTIEARRENNLREQAMAAEAARRSAIQAACNAQAAVAGASVSTPYARTTGGIFAAALIGALESAAVEERTRANCYRLNGL